MHLKRALPLFLLFLAVLPARSASLYPMECGDLRRENRSLSPSPLRNPLRIQWAAPPCLDLKTPVSNPIVLSDRVVQTFRKGIRCFDRDTGARLWTWTCNTKTELFNAPCYDGGRGLLYVGCYNGDTLALRAQDGTVAWYYPHTPSSFPVQYSSPLFAQGRLYVGNGGSGFLCLDPDTRATIWQLDFSSVLGKPYSAGTCTPAYDNGNIYLPLVFGKIFSLNASTGAVQWIQDQHVDHVNTCLLSDEYVYSLGGNAQLQCRRRTDGGLVWQADTHVLFGGTNGNLALCGDMLIVPGDSWVIWGLNRFTGAKCWSTTLTGNFALNSPMVVCGKVYISACHGDFYSLDGQTGNIEWRLHHGEELTFVGWAEADGQLFVGTSRGKTLCFTSQTPGDPAACVCNLQAVPVPPGPPSPIPAPLYPAYPTCAMTATFTPTATRTPTGTLTPVNTYTPTPTWTPTISPTSAPASLYHNTTGQVAAVLGAPPSIVDEARALNLSPEITYVIIVISLHCGCHPHDLMVLRLNMGWDDIARQYGLDWGTLMAQIVEQTKGLAPEGATTNQILRTDANDPTIFPVEIPPTPVPTNQPLQFQDPVQGGNCP